MTIQEAKDFLNRGYRSRERIKVKEERIDEWIRRAESITAEIKPVASFSSTPSKKVEDAACAIVDLQSEREFKRQLSYGKLHSCRSADITANLILSPSLYCRDINRQR